MTIARRDYNGRPFIDRDKVKRAEHLDGKFVLTTNDDTLSVADIALGYKGMWIVESCFRRMKTTGLEVRPMFHLMPHRITAHVKLCVLALMIQRAAERDQPDLAANSGPAWPHQGGPLHCRGPDHFADQENPSRSPRRPKKLDIPTPKTILDVA